MPTAIDRIKRQLEDANSVVPQDREPDRGVTQNRLLQQSIENTFVADPSTVSGATFEKAHNENITQRIADIVSTGIAARQESEMLSPEQANEMFKPATPYMRPIKMSLAAQDAVIRERSRAQDEILAQAGSYGYGTGLLPMAAGLGGSILDPAGLASGFALSTAIKGGALAMQAGKYAKLGKFLAGGSMVEGKFIEGSLTQRVSAEVVDQFIGNLAIESTVTPAAALAAGDRPPSLSEVAGNAVSGTIVGVPFAMGLHWILNARSKSKIRKAIENEVVNIQAEEGMKINLDPINKAANNSLPTSRNVLHGEVLPKVGDVAQSAFKGKESLDISAQAAGKLKNKTLFLPVSTEGKGISKQVYTGEALGLNTLQFVDDPNTALALSYDALNTDNNKSRVIRTVFESLDLADGEAPINTPKLAELYEKMFGEKPPADFTLKELFLEAQRVDAKSVDAVETALVEDGFDGVGYKSIENGANVIELIKGKDYRVIENNVHEEVRQNNKQEIDALTDAKREMLEYSKNYDNKVIADENRLEWKQREIEAPKVGREQILETKENVINIKEELIELDKIEKELQAKEEDELFKKLKAQDKLGSDILKMIDDISNAQPDELSKARVRKQLTKEFDDAVHGASLKPLEEGFKDFETKHEMVLNEGEKAQIEEILFDDNLSERDKNKQLRDIAHTAQQRDLRVVEDTLTTEDVVDENVIGERDTEAGFGEEENIDLEEAPRTYEADDDLVKNWARDNGHDEFLEGGELEDGFSRSDEMDPYREDMDTAYYDDSDKFGKTEFDDPIEKREAMETAKAMLLDESLSDEVRTALKEFLSCGRINK